MITLNTENFITSEYATLHELQPFVGHILLWLAVFKQTFSNNIVKNVSQRIDVKLPPVTFDNAEAAPTPLALRYLRTAPNQETANEQLD